MRGKILSSDKALTPPQLFLRIDSEYRELNNNIRESWKYISDLMRVVVFLQVVLISVILFGANVVKIDNISFATSKSQSFDNSNEHSNEIEGEKKIALK